MFNKNRIKIQKCLHTNSVPYMPETCVHSGALPDVRWGCGRERDRVEQQAYIQKTEQPSIHNSKQMSQHD